MKKINKDGISRIIISAILNSEMSSFEIEEVIEDLSSSRSEIAFVVSNVLSSYLSSKTRYNKQKSGFSATLDNNNTLDELDKFHLISALLENSTKEETIFLLENIYPSWSTNKNSRTSKKTLIQSFIALVPDDRFPHIVRILRSLVGTPSAGDAYLKKLLEQL